MSSHLVKCPHCENDSDERTLATRHILEATCKHCGHAITLKDSKTWKNTQLINNADVTAIDQWLFEVEKENPQLELEPADGLTKSHGFHVCKIGGLQWRCEVFYNPLKTYFVAIRMVDSRRYQLVTHNRARWISICSDHGVQPHGWDNSSGGAWGAQQFLHTDEIIIRLDPTLFQSTAKRLSNAMSDIATTFGIDHGDAEV